MYILPGRTRDVGEILSTELAVQKVENSKILLILLRSIAFLARQGLPLRGDGKEVDSNFRQLLLLQATENKKSQNGLVNPQTPLHRRIYRMALKLLGDITKRIRKAKFFTLMADEATDAGNKEQLVIVFRWVDET